MTEVVSSIKRVTDIMGEISSASNEQALGVAQVGEAVTQMDQATQQNAALVEEMAAAASSLKSQAQELVQTVAVFQLGNTPVHRTSMAPRQASSTPRAQLPPARKMALGNSATPFQQKRASLPAPPKKLVAPKPAPKAPAAQSDDDWETF
jgi:hypothetical protein